MPSNKAYDPTTEPHFSNLTDGTRYAIISLMGQGLDDDVIELITGMNINSYLKGMVDGVKEAA